MRSPSTLPRSGPASRGAHFPEPHGHSHTIPEPSSGLLFYSGELVQAGYLDPAGAGSWLPTTLLLPDGRLLHTGSGDGPGLAERTQRRALFTTVPVQGGAPADRRQAREGRIRRAICGGQG